MTQTRRKQSVVELEDVQCDRMTKLALRCHVPSPKLHGKTKVIWIPKSLVHEDSEVFDAVSHNRGKLVIPEWLAFQEELV